MDSCSGNLLDQNEVGDNYIEYRSICSTIEDQPLAYTRVNTDIVSECYSYKPYKRLR
jgi:hypothetical protein